MSKCRICLKNRKNMVSLFDEVRNNICSFAEMINSIGNLKITEHEGITDRICRSCCVRAAEAYDFVIIAQRSDYALREETNKHLRRIHFSDINEIKHFANVTEIEVDSKEKTKLDCLKQYFECGSDEITYNDTLIKKLNNTIENKENTPVSVFQFLDSIKREDDDNLDDTDHQNYDYDSDDEYVPLIERKKKIKKNLKYKKSKQSGKDRVKESSQNVLKVLIQPIFRDDLRLISTKSKITKIRRVQKYTRNKRCDVCPYCGKLSASMKGHILTHTGERKHTCDICSKGFFTEYTLRRHKITHREKTLKCDKCTAVFNDAYTLQTHMSSHTHEKTYICEICKKKFKWKHGLVRHCLIHNLANKRIKCELCEMTFFTKGHMKHHMRVHTRERPFNCELCSQPYSYKRDFNRHCIKKHGVFLKRRNVYVMNEEVLKRERELMKGLVLRMEGIRKQDEPLNPFEGPQAAQAFEQAMEALQAQQIPIYND